MVSRKLAILVAGICAVLTILSCKNSSSKESQVIEPSAIEISIKGMTCTGCEETIKSSISKLEGIKSVTATFTDGKAIVVYLPGKTDTLLMKQAITDKGYSVNKFTAIPVPDVTN